MADVDSIVREFKPRVQGSAQTEDAVKVYRSTLAAAPDHSVTIVAVGFATVLLQLLRSTLDGVSHFNGYELVARKVQRMVMMGGRHHFHDWDPVEWNWGELQALCVPYVPIGQTTH